MPETSLPQLETSTKLNTLLRLGFAIELHHEHGLLVARLTKPGGERTQEVYALEASQLLAQTVAVGWAIAKET